MGHCNLSVAVYFVAFLDFCYSHLKSGNTKCMNFVSFLIVTLHSVAKRNLTGNGLFTTTHIFVMDLRSETKTACIITLS